MLIAFPLQQWLRERVPILHLYVHCVSCCGLICTLAVSVTWSMVTNRDWVGTDCLLGLQCSLVKSAQFPAVRLEILQAIPGLGCFSDVECF
jgi:hypothetical protein